MASKLSTSGAVMVAALAILLILTLIFMAVLTFGVARFSEARRAKNRVIAKYAAETGVTRMVVEMNRLNHVIVDTLRDSLENGASFTTTAEPWGGFLLVRSVGTFANQEVIAFAQVGTRPPDVMQAALTVGDTRYPVILSRGSRIHGDVNVGPLGMTTGDIAGIGVRLDACFFGEIYKRANLSVPPIDSTSLTWTQLMATTPAAAGTVLVGAQLWDDDHLTEFNRKSNLFVDGPLSISGRWRSNWQHVPRVTVSGAINISGQSSLSGFAVVVSKSYIVVSDSTRLDGVLLAAEDSIIFENHSNFSGVAVSHGQIIVRDQAQSQFPAAFITIPPPISRLAATGITLSTSGTIEGVCYVMSDFGDTTESTSRLSIAPHVRFSGEIVTQGQADISGIVAGSIWMQQSRFVEEPTTYINWIRNLTINRPALQYEMPLPVLDQPQSTFAIIRLETQP